MKTVITALSLLLLVSVTSSHASDSFSLGIRGGATPGHSGYFTEVFGDIYLNRLISIGATFGYTVTDWSDRNSYRRDESTPITALFKIHAPTPILKPYAGLGEAIIFDDRYPTKGTPVGIIGVRLPLGPLFLNVEYRRHLHDSLNMLGFGGGISF